MSSVNPVFVLPGALAERAAAIAQGFVTAVTGSAGQLCTKPGLLFVLERTERPTSFVAAAADSRGGGPGGTDADRGHPARLSVAGPSALGATPGVSGWPAARADDSLAAPGEAQLYLTTGANFLGRTRACRGGLRAGRR